jgi:hypothetical protein
MAVLKPCESPREVGYGVVEFGDFVPAAVVGNHRNDDCWRTYHHPAKQDNRYVFHFEWLGKFG